MTTFTKTLACLNLLGAGISITLFIATWFAQGIIVEKARDHALESTRNRLEPVVKFLENSKLTQKFPASIEERLQSELMDYQSDPRKWLLEVATGTGERATAFKFPEIKNPLAGTVLGALTQKVSNASEHFRRSLDNLILDLRIFCGTNACAFLLAGWLLYIARTPKMRSCLGVWSVALLISTGFGTYCYINQSWVWSLLRNDYFGWSYPALNAFIALYLILHLSPPFSSHSGK